MADNPPRTRTKTRAWHTIRPEPARKRERGDRPDPRPSENASVAVGSERARSNPSGARRKCSVFGHADPPQNQLELNWPEISSNGSFCKKENSKTRTQFILKLSDAEWQPKKATTRFIESEAKAKEIASMTLGPKRKRAKTRAWHPLRLEHERTERKHERDAFPRRKLCKTRAQRNAVTKRASTREWHRFRARNAASTRAWRAK